MTVLASRALNLLSTLLKRELHVVLHPHVDHIGGRSNHSTTRTGRSSQQNLPEKVQITAESLLAHLVNTEAGGRVRQLTEERRRDAVVERADSLLADDVARQLDDRNFCLLRGLQLNFDEI